MHIHKHLSSLSPVPCLAHMETHFTVLHPAFFSPQDVLKRFPCQYIEICYILEYCV